LGRSSQAKSEKHSGNGLQRAAAHEQRGDDDRQPLSRLVKKTYAYDFNQF
jgi:hypothetical protein